MKRILFLDKQKLNDIEKESMLRKVLGSSEFKKSKIYKDLLTYLFNKSLKKEVPKELTIAMEFFNKKSDFNPSEDSSVRQHIYYLREKLKKFYLEEGKNEKIKMFIPKGSYTIQFVKAPVFIKIIERYKDRFLYLMLLILFMALAFQTWNLNSENKTTSNFKNSLIWSDIKNSEKPDIILLGNSFFYREYQQEIETSVRVRNFDVNSILDLDNLKTEYPLKKDMREAKDIYFPKSCVWALSKMIPLYTKLGMEFNLLENSKVTINDIKENDIVLIGNYQTLGLIGTLISKALNINYDPLIIHYNDENNDPKQFGEPTLQKSYTFHKDYCLFIKIPGPNNNHITIISSSHQTGMNGVVDIVTNPVSLAKFETEIKKEFSDPRYFVAVFKVSGFKMTNYKSELVFFEKISNDKKLW